MNRINGEATESRPTSRPREDGIPLTENAEIAEAQKFEG